RVFHVTGVQTCALPICRSSIAIGLVFCIGKTHRAYMSKTWATGAINYHLLGKHRRRAYPPAVIAVQTAVNHQRLAGFTVSGATTHPVAWPLVMAIFTRLYVHLCQPFYWDSKLSKDM